MPRRSTWAGIVLLVIILLGASFQTPLLHTARNSVWDRWVGIIGKWSGLRLNEPDQNRLEELLAENIRLKAELRDYARLRRDLGSASFNEFKAVPASVMGRPIDTFRSEFRISRGTKAGVTMAAPVVVNGSTLIGFVTDVSDESSVVRLLFHPSTTVTAHVIDPQFSEDAVSTSGLVQGRHYTSLFLTTVPRDTPLHTGSRVVTAAKAGELPEGLFIGTVKTIFDQQSATYTEASLEIPYDIDAVRAVTVLTLP